MASTTNDFLSCLRASEIIDANKLEHLLAANDTSDQKQFALRLVKSGILTKWQAKYLFSGRHVLKLGNYKLLERISRSDIGDRFLAIHTRLDRMVEIQVLPATLQKNKALRDAFIEKASRASNIDHANLIHVLDIDQEGKRFYLVVEHGTGQKLAEFPTEKLNDVDIARIVEQAASGLKEAHQHDLIHGRLNEEQIVVTDDSVVKVVDLVIAQLADLTLETTPRDDFNQLGAIGVRLLSTVSTTAPTRKSLFEILDQLSNSDGSNTDELLERLGTWIEDNDHVTGKSIKSAAAIIANETSDAAAGTPAASAAARMQDSGPAKHSQPKSTSNSASVERAGAMKKSPAMLYASLGIVGLIAVGVAVWVSGLLSGSADVPNENKVAVNSNRKPAKTAKQATVTRDGDDTRTHQKNSVLRNPSTAQGDAKEAINQFFGKTGSEPGEKTADADNNANLIAPSESTESKTETKNPASEQADPQNPVDPAGAEPPAPTETPAPVNPVVSESNNDLPPKPPEQSGESSQGVVLNLSEPPNATSKETAEPQASPNEAPNTSASTTPEPFASFPKQIELPPPSDTQLTHLGNVTISKNYLMAAELLAGREICKTRIAIVMSRNEDDKQRWTVTVAKRKTEPAVPVAEFSKQEEKINFQWLESAVNTEFADYIRNCTLKLKSKDKAFFVDLRKPVELGTLAVSEANEFVAKLEHELPWLPDSGSIKVELQPVQFGDFDGKLQQKMAARKSPGIILFSDKETQHFAWLQIEADVRRKLKLTAKLLLANPNGRPKTLTKKNLSALTSAMKLAADQKYAQHQHLQQMDDRGDKPDEFRTKTLFRDYIKTLKAESEAMQTGAADAIQLESMLAKVLDQPIPLIVYFESEDRRTELARTTVQ